MDYSVDLIIPTYAPDKKLDILLERILMQDVKPSRILLLNTVIEGKEEIVNSYVEKYGVEVYPISRDEFDHGATRAYGADLSDAEFILFMTQDAVPADSHLISSMLKGFENEEVSVCYGRQLSGKHGDVIEQFTRQFNYPDKTMLKSKEDIETMGIKAFFCSDVCAMYRKKVYDELGGFVKKTIFNEDMIMAYHMIQAGYKILYEKDAKVVHSHNYGYMQQFHRNFDLGVSHKQYEEVFGNIKSESEGIRLVVDTAHKLVKEGKYLKVVDLAVASGFKYVGYRAGLLYKKLPKSVIMKCTSNKGYWKDNKEL